MAAWRHKSSLRVLKTFHEWVQQTNNVTETCFGKDLSCDHGNADVFTREGIRFSGESSPGKAVSYTHLTLPTKLEV